MIQPWQIIVLIILVFFSAFFSATETAYSSLNKVRLKSMAQLGNKGAKRALKYSENFDKLITTILIGNNIVNITSTVIATTMFVAAIGNDYGELVSTIVMTASILVFGEILPKSISKEFPEKFAILVAPVIGVFYFILTPFSWVFSKLKNGISKLIRIKDDRSITEDELLTMVDEAETDGGINENEGNLIRNVIEFDDEVIENILTPRVRIIGISTLDSNDDILTKFRKSGYSRLPVYEDTVDNIIGVVNHKDFYNYVLLGTERLDTVTTKPVYVTERMKITDLLTLLRTQKSHMAIVKDEFGGTVGLVTMEDILEEIVGDIWDEHDEIIEQIIQINENNYRVKGLANLDDLFERIGIEQEVDSVTVNGWIQEILGAIPKKGTTFESCGLKVTVLKATDTSILEANIEVLPTVVEEE